MNPALALANACHQSVALRLGLLSQQVHGTSATIAQVGHVFHLHPHPHHDHHHTFIIQTDGCHHRPSCRKAKYAQRNCWQHLPTKPTPRQLSNKERDLSVSERPIRLTAMTHEPLKPSYGKHFLGCDGGPLLRFEFVCPLGTHVDALGLLTKAWRGGRQLGN